MSVQKLCLPYLALAILLPFSLGCSPAARSRIGTAIAGAASGAAAGSNRQVKLMVFGGQDHKTYLGCLNCSEYATDSILNSNGPHGNSYSNESIWNHYSIFGSAYSPYGACNPYASDPPVIVDEQGNYYGRLTLNAYHTQLGIGVKAYDWLKTQACE